MTFRNTRPGDAGPAAGCRTGEEAQDLLHLRGTMCIAAMRVLGSLILAVAVAAAIGIAASAAVTRVVPTGTIVLSCSGCPQQPGGPVLLGISVRSGEASTLV